MSIDKAAGFAKTLRTTRTRLDDAINLIRQAQTLSEITTPTNHIVDLGERAYSVGTQIASRANQLNGHRTTPRINNLPPGRLTTPGGGHPGTITFGNRTIQTTGRTGGPGSTISTGPTTPTAPRPANTSDHRGVSAKFIEANTTPLNPNIYAPTVVRNASFDPGQNPFGSTPTAFAVPHPGQFGTQPTTKPPANPAPKTGWEAYAALPGGEFSGLAPGPPTADQVAADLINEFTHTSRRTARSHHETTLQTSQLAEQILFGELEHDVSRQEIAAAIDALVGQETDIRKKLAVLINQSTAANSNLAGNHTELTLDLSIDMLQDQATQLLATHTSQPATPGRHNRYTPGTPALNINQLAFDIETLATTNPAQALILKAIIDTELSPTNQANLNRILAGHASYAENAAIALNNPAAAATGAAKSQTNFISDLIEPFFDRYLRSVAAADRIINHGPLGTPGGTTTAGGYHIPSLLEQLADTELEVPLNSRAEQGGATIATTIELAFVPKAIAKTGLTVVKIGTRFFLKNSDNLIAITDDVAEQLALNTAPSTTYRVRMEGPAEAADAGLEISPTTVKDVAADFGVTFPTEALVTIRSGAPPGYLGATFGPLDVDLYHGAFSSRENLARTLFHERLHLWQHQTYGTQHVVNNVLTFEDATYAAEANWWQVMNEGLN